MGDGKRVPLDLTIPGTHYQAQVGLRRSQALLGGLRITLSVSGLILASMSPLSSALPSSFDPRPQSDLVLMVSSFPSFVAFSPLFQRQFVSVSSKTWR